MITVLRGHIGVHTSLRGRTGRVPRMLVAITGRMLVASTGGPHHTGVRFPSMLVAITGRPGAASLAGVLHAVHAMDTGRMLVA